MGNGEAEKASKPNNSSSLVQEQSGANPYRDWPTMQAYYGGGVTVPPYFGSNVSQAHSPHPYMWPPPIMMPPFGAPYSGIYQPGGPYAQPPDANGGNSAIKSPSEIIPGPRAETKSSSRNRKDNELGSSGEASSNSQSEGLDSNGGKKLNFRHGNVTLDNRASQTIVKENGMGQSAAAGSHMPFNVHQDEREVKKEKRKQSNRESARRSRLRKQAETEDLAQKVEAMIAENQALRSEVSRLTKESASLKLENSALQEKLEKETSQAVVNG